MKQNFIKEIKIFDKSEKEHNNELLKELEASRKRLMSYYNNINLSNNNLVDYYAYQIKAEKAKYGYLLQKIKSANV